MALTQHEIDNRFGRHGVTAETKPKHQAVRERFAEMCAFLDDVLPDGRAKSVCLTELETTGMWANKAVAELAPLERE